MRKRAEGKRERLLKVLRGGKEAVSEKESGGKEREITQGTQRGEGGGE